jgi:glycosyltransferase involved in cell wall biosynthesis
MTPRGSSAVLAPTDRREGMAAEAIALHEIEASSSTRSTVSVVIPAMNEEHNIGWVLERVPNWVDEVVLVDGFSSDRTVEVARATRRDVVVVRQRGRGKGAALRSGFEVASCDYIIAIDADGSMEPAEIEYYVAALEQGYELVKGSRHLRASGSLDLTPVRRLGNTALVGTVNLLWGCTFSDLCYGFFGFRRDKLDALGLTSGGFEIETEIAVRAVEARLRIAEVPSVELLRHHGTSNLNAWRDGWRILRLLARERLPINRRPLVDELDRRSLQLANTRW